jgi:hypothetical protein
MKYFLRFYLFFLSILFVFNIACGNTGSAAKGKPSVSTSSDTEHNASTLNTQIKNNQAQNNQTQPISQDSPNTNIKTVAESNANASIKTKNTSGQATAYNAGTSGKKTKKKKKEDSFYIISEFIIPKGHQLHIKVWKDGVETEEYYLYEVGVGVKLGSDIIKHPQVDDLCCILYGKKGNLNPFSIDLKSYGKGLTDLPGCTVENSEKPAYSKKVVLPAVIPNFNM